MRRKIITILLLVGLVMSLSGYPVAASEDGGTIDTGIGTGGGGSVRPAPTAYPVAGTYSSAVTVTLTAAESVSIYYSLSNPSPTNSTGTLYGSAISIGSTSTLYAVAYWADGTAGRGSYSYTITITGGGGGGGGGYTTPTPTPVSGIGEVTWTVSANGTLASSVTLVSADGNCTVNINQGVTAFDKDGNPLGRIAVAPPTGTPPLGVIAIYEFTPSGATFSPPGARITMKYDPAKVPAGMSESSLTLAFYDTSSTPPKWVELTNIVVDTVNKTISGYTTHFSQFAVISASLLKPPTVAGTTVVSGVIDTKGIFSDTVIAVSADPTATKVVKNAALTIAKGTVGLDKEGKPLVQITMVEMATPPAQPDKYILINMAYSFGPDGATFNPATDLTISYDPGKLPAGVVEKNIVIGYYDVAQKTWIEVPSTVDTVKHAVTAKVSHFTAFALLSKIAAAAPGSFKIGAVNVSPLEVNANEKVEVGATVQNSGSESGKYTVTFKIDGTTEATKEVTVAAGASEKVTFTTSKADPGKYTVDLNGQSGSFTVKAPAAPPEPTGLQPWHYVLIGLGIVALLVGGYILVLRRRQYTM